MKKQTVCIGIAFCLAGCHTDMWHQAKVTTFDESGLFKDGSASRPRVPGAVPYGKFREKDAFYTGYENGKLVTEFPLKLTKELLEKGEERFNVFCVHCHGALGYGNGMITQRGLELARVPSNYHTYRLREMPVGHLYEVITKGYGTMFPFADRTTPEERWAIAAYVRVLQRSQEGQMQDVPEKEKSNIQPYEDSFIRRKPIKKL